MNLDEPVPLFASINAWLAHCRVITPDGKPVTAEQAERLQAESLRPQLVVDNTVAG